MKSQFTPSLHKAVPEQPPKKPIVINIFGGPGVGKSTTAWKVSSALSELGYIVEYLPEFAKGLTWSNSHHVLRDQLYVFANQVHPLEMTRDKALDFVVVDSPLPTSLVYMPPDFYKSFEPLVIEVFKSFTNMTYLLRRETQYVDVGRSQSPEEATLIDKRIAEILKKHDIEHQSIGLSDRDRIILDAIQACRPSVAVPELPTDVSARIRDMVRQHHPESLKSRKP